MIVFFEKRKLRKRLEVAFIASNSDLANSSLRIIGFLIKDGRKVARYNQFLNQVIDEIQGSKNISDRTYNQLIQVRQEIV